MTKRMLKMHIGIFAIYYIVYMIAVINESNLWGNILSPIGTMYSAAILFYSSKKTKDYKISWIIAGWACLSWALVDVLWFFYDAVLKINPDELDLFMYLYTIPNVFIFLSVLVYFMSQKIRWHVIQITLDALATFLIAIGVVYLLFFQEQFDSWLLLDANSITSFFYLLTDFLALSLLFVIYISMRKIRISKTLVFVFFCITMYVVTDSTYVYQVFTETYIPNSLIDGFYMLSLLLLGIASLFESRGFDRVRAKHYEDGNELPENVGSHKILYIVFGPLLVFAIKGLTPLSVVYFMSILGIHQILSLYARNYIQNELMLKQKMAMNTLLEMRIAERTEELMEANENLRIISTQDETTGLYNRRYFLENLDNMIEEVTEDESVYLLFMDLDRFKAINDSYGHDMGDRLLEAFARRLEGLKNEGLLCARLGGDEFVVAFSGIYDTSDVELLAEAIHSLCEQPVFLDHYALQLSLSIGIACYPKDSANRTSLMRNADIAMYHAKESPHHYYAFYNNWLSERTEYRNELELLINTADYDKEFHLYYQPQFRIEDQVLIGMEALLRWDSPQKGMISPSDFIPIAEENGAIISIGDWVMRKGIEQISKWNNKFGLSLKMGINVSAKQLDGVFFVDNIRKYMKVNNCAPEWVDIEITESSTMQVESSMEEILTAITGLGVSISLDDFGTGYSSLNYIKRFDIDKLKIAKPLIDGISIKCNMDDQIIKAIVMMAQAMGLRTIAEGVENDAQLQLLKEIGCDEIQGYLMGKPEPGDVFEEIYLKKENHKA